MNERQQRVIEACHRNITIPGRGAPGTLTECLAAVVLGKIWLERMREARPYVTTMNRKVEDNE